MTAEKRTLRSCVVARGSSLLAALLLTACTADEVRIAHAPAAFAGFEATVPVGERAVLDGTRSTDPDGDRLGYHWVLHSRPPDSAAEVEDPGAPLTSLVPDRPGAYVLSLTVSDGDFERRDLVGITAVAGTATASGALALDLAPRSCNGDAGRLHDAPCGISDRRVSIDPTMLVYPAALEGQLAVEWAFLRLPLGADADELMMETPQSALGEMTFAPPRPGEYWVSARLVGPSSASPPVVATVGVFDAAPPSALRPLPRIDAPAAARVGEFVLFDGRGSFVPTSTTGDRPERVWNLVADPSGGADELTDVATGCPVDECHRLVPSAAGTYLVALSIAGGVSAVVALEVR